MQLEFDGATVEQAVAGDVEAIKLLLTLARPAILKYVDAHIPDDMRRCIEADDVVQDSYVSVFRRIRTFHNVQPGGFRRWLLTIAANSLRDAKRYYRAAKRSARLVRTDAGELDESATVLIETLVGPSRTPSSCAARTEACQAVRDAIEGLPADYRRAVWMVHIEGKPVGEVAVALDRTERAVHGLCRRGLAELQAVLQSSSRFLRSAQ